jgi:glycosyltransferase involved in cell wall biosynthesis
VSEEPLRVITVIDDLRIAGAQRGLAEEARALDRSKVEMSIVSLSPPSPDDFSTQIRACGVAVHYVPGHGLRDLRRLAKLTSIIRRSRADLVHTHLDYANIIGVIAGKLAGRCVVASMRNVTTHQSRFDKSKRALEGFVLRHWVDVIVVVARTAVDETRRNFGLPASKIAVLPNAIDLDRLRLGASFDRTEKRCALRAGDDCLAVTVARLNINKGHQYLVEAVGRLATDSSIHFLFIGIGDEEANLRSQTAAAGLTNRIHFLGVRHDIPELLAAADFFVLPSLNEGLSRAMLEAMAVGTPVIATAVGGTADILADGETGWLVPPGDPGALASAIREAMENPTEARLRAERAARLVREQFTIEPHVDRLEKLYRAALARASSEQERPKRWQ